MNGVQAAFLIATFHVAGPQMSEWEEHSARQLPFPAVRSRLARASDDSGAPATPSPMSLTLALLPSPTDATVLQPNTSSARHTTATKESTEQPMPLDLASDMAPPMDAIRREIRRRRVYFQGCAAAAKRRGVPDVRRLSVTWAIAPDGSIRAMRMEGMMDPEMAACLARVGGRRFPVEPGTELTVPVAIVFVH
jgi:hypothetical protein